jgi:hypothetical protein
MANEIETLLIVDVATGQTIERELTAEEIADLQDFAEKQTEMNAQIEAQKQARISALAKLADLGLTAEEIAAL